MEIEHRPWGTYEVLLDSPECKVKRIIVNPRQRLSYQYHHHRLERWIVTKGTLTVILDGEKIVKEQGLHIHIPQGAAHRAWNDTDKPVHFIEVQLGESFDEDDIIRIEDDYKRI
jgi:mannose-6-phosphate isomerase